MICAIIDGSDLFRAGVRLRVFLIRELTRGTPSSTECARPAKILLADCATPSLYQHNPSDFEQYRQFLNSREAINATRPSSISRLLKYRDGPRGCKLERMARHERGACPSRRGGITSEKHNQTPQPAAARRVVPLFALSGVALHSQTHKGYALSSCLTQTKNQRQRGPFHYFNSLLGSEHFGRRNVHFNGSPKKVEEDPNPFFRREQASNDNLQASKRPFNNFNRLANFEGRIDGHDFFRTHSRLKPDHNVFRQGREVIAKVDDSPDAVRSFNSAMLFRIHKFREQITGKHRFYEPHWSPVGHLTEPQSRRETLDAELTPESDGSQMLPLRLRL